MKLKDALTLALKKYPSFEEKRPVIKKARTKDIHTPTTMEKPWRVDRE